MSDVALYPNCGCPPQRHGIFNLVCRNAECLNYGAHVRGFTDDRCVWCSTPYTPLYRDPFRGAR